MLEVEQVKAHSEIQLRRPCINHSIFTDASVAVKATLFYLHNEHLSRLSIICELPEGIALVKIEDIKEDDIRESIDWARFTDWINRHDDLTEINLKTKKEYSDYLVGHYKESKTIGRAGILDTIQDKVIDCNKIVLV